MSAEVDGTKWVVKDVRSITDGDTLRVVRSRLVNFDGRFYRLTDADEDRGFPIRLTWLDTPEKKDKVAWTRARQDLIDWLMDVALYPLSVTCYASAGWDRILGDVQDAQGNSASQWMMREKGWPPFVDD